MFCCCGKKIFDKLNLPYTSIILTDMGCQKGKTEVNEDLVDELSKEIMCK